MPDIRTITDIHAKGGTTAAYPSNHTIVSDNSDAWLRNIRTLWLRSFVFTGTAGTLPTVFLCIGLNAVDGHTSVTSTALTNGFREARLPLFAANNGYHSDDGRMLASADNNAPLNLCNCRIRFEYFDTATSTFLPFQDYTQCVLEFQVDVGSSQNLRIPHAI